MSINVIVPWKGSVRKFLPLYSKYKLHKLHLEAGSVQACEQSFAGLREETERMQLHSVPGFAKTASTSRCNLLTLFNTRISVQLRFLRDKFTVPVFLPFLILGFRCS